jgi:hypothetical protein
MGLLFFLWGKSLERVLMSVNWVMKNTNPAAALAWLAASERFSSPR